MTLRAAFIHRKLQTRKFLRWMVREMPHAPGLEIYSWIINRHNGQLARSLQKGGAVAFANYIAPYQGRALPRIVWMYWGQGEAQAPHVVQRCIASWRQLNPDWDIRVLDNDTLREYADISDVPAHLPPRIHANLLRLRLLAPSAIPWLERARHQLRGHTTPPPGG